MWANSLFRRPPVLVSSSIKRHLGRMEKHKVVPDVIEEVPKKKCGVRYSRLKADLGNVLTPTDVKYPPVVTWSCKHGLFYTLCMIDADAPSRKDPQWREWLHWLVVNIEKNKVAFGDVLAEYISSAPPKGTGLHRYIFLIFEQPKRLEFTMERLTNKSPAGRDKFSNQKFAAKNKLGAPIAGNFFQAEWDMYVPTVYKNLGLTGLD